MDVLKGFDRNGLDSGYFNFIPPPLIAAGGGIAIAKKNRQKKFQNQKAVGDEQRKLVEEKNKSKGVKRSRLNAELKGYDEYLNDLRNVREELLKKEQEAVVKLKQQVEETPRPTSTQEATKEDAIIESTTIEAKVETKKDDKKNNTILYVGIGVVVLLGIVLVMRKK
jgi:hypothetical protein